MYQVTDEHRHGGQGEGKEFVKTAGLLPAQALRRMGAEAGEADFSRALGAQVMTRWHHLLHPAHHVTTAISCCVGNYPRAQWLERIIYCSLQVWGSDGWLFPLDVASRCMSSGLLSSSLGSCEHTWSPCWHYTYYHPIASTDQVA